MPRVQEGVSKGVTGDASPDTARRDKRGVGIRGR